MMFSVNVLIWCLAILTSTILSVSTEGSPSAERNLYETLFIKQHYQKNVRPISNHARAVRVRIGICASSLVEIDEKTQSMTMTGCIKLKWTDESLQWKPEQFSNISWLVVPSSELWLPDIALANSANGDAYGVTKKLTTTAEVTNSGQVGYYPYGSMSTQCRMSTRFFPFDVHQCELKFESWAYPKQWLNVEPWQQNPIDTRDLVVNAKWDLLAVSYLSGGVKYDGLDFPGLRFAFRVRRRSLNYFVTHIFPALLISFLQVISHAIPVRASGARVLILAFLLLCGTALQLNLPPSNDGISLLQFYIIVININIVVSLIVTFFNIHLFFGQSKSGNVLRSFFLLNDDEECSTPQDEPLVAAGAQVDASVKAAIIRPRKIDRIFLFVMAVINILIPIMLFLILPLLQDA